jgi:hypothetical protein
MKKVPQFDVGLGQRLDARRHAILQLVLNRGGAD